MNSVITDKWIVETMRKNDWCLNEIVFVYPSGIQKPELQIPAGEKVCASITDVLYLSTDAVYLRNKKGGYTRLPWGQIDNMDWSLRKDKGRTLQAVCFLTIDGRKLVVPMPFESVPSFFGEVVDSCFRELTPGGKTCKLPGPTRFKSYAQAVLPDSVWAEGVRRERTVWVRELVCPCRGANGFTLRYLGRLLGDGMVADGDLRQRVVAECNSCREILELFDSFRHGYNAVICGEYKTEPPGRDAKTPYLCHCGKREFSLGVAAVFDSSSDTEDLIGFRKDKRSEAYGWFTAYGMCRSCKAVAKVVDYETA